MTRQIKLVSKIEKNIKVTKQNEFQIIITRNVIRLYYFGKESIKLSEFVINIDDKTDIDGALFHQVIILQNENFECTIKAINVWECKNNNLLNSDRFFIEKINLINTQRNVNTLFELRLYHLNKFPNMINYIFDDRLCVKFLQKFFDKNVVFAFFLLIPGAFRADLFRLCALYILGGIYADHKVVIIKNNLYKYINGYEYNLTMDRPLIINHQNLTPGIIHNCFMYFQRNHYILKNCIELLVEKIMKRDIKRENQYDFLQFGPMFFNNYIKFKSQDYKRFYIHKDGKHVNPEDESDTLIYTNYIHYVKPNECYIKYYYDNLVYYDSCKIYETFVLLEKNGKVSKVFI